MQNQKDLVSQPGISHGLLPLLLVFAVVGALAIGLAAYLGGGQMALAAGLSFVACLAGAWLGHVFFIYPRGDHFLVSRMYLSMAARAGIPLLLLMVCKISLEPLFSRGMVYFVILFYLVGLLTDLKIRMRMLGMGQGAKKAPSMGPAAKMDG